MDFLEQNPDLKEELRGLSDVNLTAGPEIMTGKDFLMKSKTDIPGISTIDQFCIARMENDLPDEQAMQFDARRHEDARLEKNYAAFQATRLSPDDKLIYPYKKGLIKKTRTITSWIVTALSVAAVAVLVLLLWPDSKQLAVGSKQLATNSRPANEVVIPAKAGTPSLTAKLRKAEFRNASKTREPSSVIPAKAGPSVREAMPMNSLVRRTSIAGPKIPDPLSTRILYASNYQPVMKSQAVTENVLTLPQYALQLFRERILGEDRKLVKKTRFSMWEVAGAGVERLNSVAGTKMKLNRKYDSKGDLLAVSFNSKLIDVNTPVRVQENK